MKPIPLRLLIPALLLCVPVVRAHADNHWGKAADNHIYAQQLVNELMATHPELVVVGLHAVPPGSKEEVMFATNLNRIGKQDDSDDIAVATEHKIVMAPNQTDPHKFEVQVPLLDASGHYIGATGLVFKYRAGDDLVELLARALAIRDTLAQKIPNLAALFAPTS